MINGHVPLYNRRATNYDHFQIILNSNFIVKENFSISNAKFAIPQFLQKS